MVPMLGVLEQKNSGSLGRRDKGDEEGMSPSGVHGAPSVCGADRVYGSGLKGEQGAADFIVWRGGACCRPSNQEE